LVTVAAIERVLDLDDVTWRAADEVPQNGIAEVILHSRSVIVADPFVTIAGTGRAVLVDQFSIVGGATVRLPAAEEQAVQRNITAVAHAVSSVERARANGHRGGVLWLTGLSGAGKSTLAMALERRLFDRGWQVYVLDGDNLRRGLTADLGFSPEDRSENIRRAAAAASLFAQAGTLVVAALISPARSDRERARALAGDDFREVYVSADLATCEARDPKGLYKKARAGEIPAFTGVSAPYEAPHAPDLVVDTATNSIERCVDDLSMYVEREFAAQRQRSVGAGS
jgi:bifunctional enzyme CysN/CysC